MTRRALVTGAEGFVGRGLCTHLAAQGWQVRGCDVRVPPGAAARLVCDITDREQVAQMLDWCAPLSHVFHLAAVTFVPEAIRNPVAAIEVNLQGTIRLMEAVRSRQPETRFLYVGSADVYGPPQALPIAESHRLDPANPYAISKAAADQYCAFLHESAGADIIRMRPFNHSGPGQSEQFVLSSFAQQVAQIEAGHIPATLRVGNLSAARDFSHVRDVVRAYECAALEGHAGEAYNVCSGRAQSIQEVLEKFLALSTADIRVEVDPARLRPVDVPEVYGSHEKLTAHTGWKPEIPFETLLAELLEFWRDETKK